MKKADRQHAVGNRKGTATQVAAVRDLADFHMRWLDFRPQALEIAGRPVLSDEQRELIMWLVHLADRIGPRDLSAR
jgi:hypothetical protein